MPFNIITTLLEPGTSQQSIAAACEIAWCREVAAVRVPTKWVTTCANLLVKRPVKVSAVVGLPYGASCFEALVSETGIAFARGAHEVALMLDVGALKEGDLSRVRATIKDCRDVSSPGALSVIIDVDLLDPEQLTAAYGLIKQMKLPAVEICASKRLAVGPEDIKRLRQQLHDDIRVRAIGDIRRMDVVETLYRAGVSDIVTPMGFELAQDLNDEHANRTAVFSRRDGTAGGS